MLSSSVVFPGMCLLLSTMRKRRRERKRGETSSLVVVGRGRLATCQKVSV
jgi:hypothetical protein